MPEDDALIAELTSPTYSFTSTGKMVVEAKADMKKRLLGSTASPDIADALACTFAQEVIAVAVRGSDLYQQGQQVQHEYDPLKM